MKRIALMFLLLFATVSMFAGGKECDTKHASKNVELTGTLQRVASTDGEQVYFLAVKDGAKYAVCHKSKAAALKLADEKGAKVQVKGSLVSCGENTELMIQEAKRI